MDSANSRSGLLYFADGGIVVNNLWDPFSPDQLIRYVDDFADCGIDILSQMVFAGGTTKPGLFAPDHPDVTWWENEHFRGMIDRGEQPIECMIGRAHERGMRFFAKLRMSDWHDHPPEARPFVTAHPELHNPSWPTRPVLDYSHARVREYHLSLIDELARRFDLDGISLNFIRSWYSFPKEVGRNYQSVMTDFMRQVRRCLHGHAERKGRSLELGVIVLPVVELCEDLGYDLQAWAEEGLIDYLSCGNGHYTDPNQDHRPWANLCRGTGCRYYPMLQCGISQQDKVGLLRPEHIRALARAMYDGGADGISVFNWVYYWARRGGVARYPGPGSGHLTALDYLRELRGPDAQADGSRHYLFRPIGMEWEASGRIYEENYRVVFPRRVGARGEYRFYLPEDLARCGRCELFVHALGLNSSNGQDGARDQVALDVNGRAIPPAQIRRTFHLAGRLERFGAPLPPHTTLWFELAAPPARRGENTLGVHLTQTGTGESMDVTLEEVEVVVTPRSAH